MDAVFDDNAAIPPKGWSYQKKPVFQVDIRDTLSAYRLSLNLRHTGEYKYSNLFLLVSLISPAGDTLTDRHEFTLADQTGQWLGDGSGNIYTYRIPIIDSLHFDRSGTWQVQLEQNMRDHVLPAIKDVGIRVDSRKPVK